jgi:hypothetical protein
MQQTDSFETTLWNELDYIGIDAYFINRRDPSIEVLNES